MLRSLRKALLACVVPGINFHTMILH